MTFNDHGHINKGKNKIQKIDGIFGTTDDTVRFIFWILFRYTFLLDPPYWKITDVCTCTCAVPTTDETDDDHNQPSLDGNLARNLTTAPPF